MTVNQTRSALYRAARLLGDYQAVRSGSPEKMAKRYVRKRTGLTYGRLVRRLLK